MWGFLIIDDPSSGNQDLGCVQDEDKRIMQLNAYLWYLYLWHFPDLLANSTQDLHKTLEYSFKLYKHFCVLFFHYPKIQSFKKSIDYTILL